MAAPGDDTRRLADLEEENTSLRGAILLLHRISNLVRGAVELEPTCYALLTGVTAGVGLGLNRAMLFLVDAADRNVLRGAAAVGPASREEADRVWKSIKAAAPDLEVLYEAGLRERESPGLLDRRVRALRVDATGDSPIAVALRAGTTVEGAGTDALGGLLHLPTAIAAPLRGRSTIRGVLYADNIYTELRIKPVSQLVFSLLADHAGRAIENARRFEQMAVQARTDALTGLAHHGALMEELGRAVATSRQAGRPLGLVMVDLDDFKHVNDTHGHLVGDALLAGVASRLRAAARTSESPYRYGGEEFTVVLPGADRAAAAAVGDRLRRAVGDRPFSVGSVGVLSVTCSVGVASLPEDGADAETLVDAADAAMLRAKALGKDRVELAGGT
jgi:diguanylate cyclase (GGDEF)-like protein